MEDIFDVLDALDSEVLALVKVPTSSNQSNSHELNHDSNDKTFSRNGSSSNDLLFKRKKQHDNDDEDNQEVREKVLGNQIIWNDSYHVPKQWISNNVRLNQNIASFSDSSLSVECIRNSAISDFKISANELARNIASNRDVPPMMILAWLNTRKFLETRMASRDGRQWDDPVIPWRFVDKVDSEFMSELIALKLTTKEALKFVRKLGKLAHRTHKKLRGRVLGGEDTRVVQVVRPNHHHTTTYNKSSSSMTLEKNINMKNVYILKSGKLSLSIHEIYYQKLKSLFLLSQSSSHDHHQRNQYQVQQHKSMLKANDILFHEKLFCLLLRYSTQSPGFHVSLNGEVFDVLLKHFECGFECFASPLNSRYRFHCSEFMDTDRSFGSIGSFFDFYPTEGSYQAFPPYLPIVINNMARHIISLLNKADGQIEEDGDKEEEDMLFNNNNNNEVDEVDVNNIEKDDDEEDDDDENDEDDDENDDEDVDSNEDKGKDKTKFKVPEIVTTSPTSSSSSTSSSTSEQHALSFIVFLPTTRQFKGFKLLEGSRFLRGMEFVSKDKFNYCDGTKHCSKQPHRHATNDIAVFFLQSKLANERWPITEQAIAELRSAFISTLNIQSNVSSSIVLKEKETEEEEDKNINKKAKVISNIEHFAERKERFAQKHSQSNSFKDNSGGGSGSSSNVSKYHKTNGKKVTNKVSNYKKGSTRCKKKKKHN